MQGWSIFQTQDRSFSRAMDRSFPRLRNRIFQSKGLRMFLSKKHHPPPQPPIHSHRLPKVGKENFQTGGPSLSSEQRMTSPPEAKGVGPLGCSVMLSLAAAPRERVAKRTSLSDTQINSKMVPSSQMIQFQALKVRVKAHCSILLQRRRKSKRQVPCVNSIDVKDLRASFAN